MKTTPSLCVSKILTTTIASTLSLGLLTSCGSSSDNQEDQFSKVGVITVQDSSSLSGTTDIDIHASFTQLSAAVSRTDLESAEFYQPSFEYWVNATGLAPDSCAALASYNSEENNLPSLARTDITTENISAGERLAARRSGSVLVELAADTNLEYSGTASVEYPLATDARITITIPGEDFEAYPTLEVPEIEQLLLDNPPQFPLVAGLSTISWIPTTNSNSTLTLVLFGANFLSDTTDMAFCSLVDDGEFTLPIELADELNVLNVNPEFLFMILNRMNESTAIKDDSIVNVRRVSTAIEFE